MFSLCHPLSHVAGEALALVFGGVPLPRSAPLRTPFTTLADSFAATAMAEHAPPLSGPTATAGVGGVGEGRTKEVTSCVIVVLRKTDAVPASVEGGENREGGLFGVSHAGVLRAMYHN